MQKPFTGKGFPVFEGEKENIIGILMTKDLLKWQRAPEIHLKVFLRTAVFVPETKNLIDLLRDFKTELKRIRGGDWDEDKKD